MCKDTLDESTDPWCQPWISVFMSEAAAIWKIMKGNLSQVEHVGSTALLCVPSAPCIDIAVEVSVFGQDSLLSVSSCLSDIGYTVVNDTLAFSEVVYTKQLPEEVVSVRVYCFSMNSNAYKNAVLLRNYLVTHPHLCVEYGMIKKMKLGTKPGYINAKNEFFAYLQQQPGFEECALVPVKCEDEWQEYHRLRKEQIWDVWVPTPYDPADPVLKDPSRHHFVMYRSKAVAAAIQIHFLDKTRAAIRAMAVDKPFQRQGIGRQAVLLAERWIRERGYRTILLHSAIDATGFYAKLGYQFMDFEEGGQNLTNCVQHIDMGKVV